MRLSRKVVGFKKIQFYTGDNLGYGDVVLPEHELHVPACWTTLGAPAIERLVASGLSRRAIVEAMVGAAKALHAVSCVLLACDRRDLGTAIGDARGAGEEAPGLADWFEQPSPSGGSRARDADGQEVDLEALERFEPTLFLHENVPGGTGFAPLLFDHHPALLREARGLVERCTCDAGCPACVGPPLEVGESCRRDAGTVLGLLTEATGSAAVAPVAAEP